jgi:ribosome recycling factor
MEDYRQIIEKTKPEMEKILAHLQDELKRVRADRATPSLVEDIVVDCFDQRLPLKQLAAISCPEQRQILIQPWDKNYIRDILSALQKSESDFSPMIEGSSLRIILPPLTEEYRKSLLKILSSKKEDARVSLKRVREDSWRQIQEKEQKGEITEDDKFKGKDELQKIIDEYNKKAEEVVKKREDEIRK